MAADIDLLDELGRNRSQADRRVEITKRVDTSVHDIGAAADAAIIQCPKGFVYEGCDVHLVTAEGAIATIDIGREADPDEMLDGGNVNGTPGALVARAGTEALAPGAILSEALVQVTAVNALDAAVFDVTLRGYIQKYLG